MKIKYSKTNIKVVDSYKINQKEDMISILNTIKQEHPEYKRTIKSWLNEWKTHNILYKLHLFRSHTKDVDLSENESKILLFLYKVIGGGENMEKVKKIAKYVTNILAIINAVLLGLSPIWNWNTSKISDSIIVIIGVIGVYLLGNKAVEVKKGN